MKETLRFRCVPLNSPFCDYCSECTDEALRSHSDTADPVKALLHVKYIKYMIYQGPVAREMWLTVKSHVISC